MTLLFLIDLSIGLLGHLNSQLQLIALAFPAKMIAALAALESFGFVDSQAVSATRRGGLSPRLGRLLGL